jgi:hypothetical protein
MKGKIFLALVASLLLFTSVAEAQIDSVSVFPNPVREGDFWLINVRGTVAESNIRPTDATLTRINATDFTFDILFESVGIGLPIPTPFNYDFPQLPLAAGTYNLHVRTSDFPPPGTFETIQFTVVPEPAAAGMVVAALVLVSRRRRAAA